MTNANSRYWLCQVAGWGVVALAILYFAHAYKSPLSTNVILGRVVVVFVTGILITHTLRSFLKWRGWMFQSIEKIVPKLLAAVIVTSVVFSLIVLVAFELLGLQGPQGTKVTFLFKLLGSVFDNTLLIFPWVVFYYFYHFIEKNRKQEMDTLQLEALIK